MKRYISGYKNKNRNEQLDLSKIVLIYQKKPKPNKRRYKSLMLFNYHANYRKKKVSTFFLRHLS